ncbi:MAG TPA: PD-(D/E)XK nuclease family protein [Eubacteriales bacterium]|nr:PD-(D/E)XK nuclease family protein [Eubacteriales bacterium]
MIENKENEKTFKDYINASNELVEDSKYATVLDIIRKPYEELFVSRILAYLFNPKSNGDDPIFLNEFLEKINVNQRVGSNDKVKIYLEKYAYGKRIDILIEVVGKFVITIENKINSFEHDNQTDYYYDFCEKYYAKYDLKKYVFLKPHYNRIKPINENFDIVTYDDIIEILKTTENGKNENYNIIAKDFIEHCRRYLMKEIKISESDLLYLNNIDKITEAQNSYENIMDQIKSLVKAEIDESQNKSLKWQIADDGNTYRIYSNDWWQDRRFYLYSEVKYNNNSLYDIECQITIKGYINSEWDLREDDSWFKKMIKKLQDKGYEIKEIVSMQWYVLQRKIFNEFDFEKRQISELVDEIVNIMNEYIEQSKKIAEIIQTNL